MIVTKSMNQAHLHIILVHVPVLFVPLGIVLFIIGLVRQNLSIKYTALGIFIFSAIMAFFANQLGEGAEDLVKHLAGIIKSNIHEHEEMGDKALWITVALGLVSIFNWHSLGKHSRQNRLLTILLLFLALFSSSGLTYTAFLGGKIRHPEAYSQAASESDSTLAPIDNDSD